MLNNQPIQWWLGIIMAACLSTPVLAQPVLSVISLGANGAGDLQWRVDVGPDASLFAADGTGSLAAEIGFELDGSTFLSASPNEAVWAFETPGSNPFTNSITTGLSLMDTEAFVSFGSEPVTEMVELLTFTTQGAETTTLSWGGYQVLSGQPGEFEGGRLAQAGVNFNGVAGSVSAGSIALAGDCNGDGTVDAGDLMCACGSGGIDDVLAATGLLSGDLDGDGGVRFADFLVLSSNFGNADVGYPGGDIDCNGTVGFADFLVLSDKFGQTSQAAVSVPEPKSSELLLLLTIVLLPICRRRSIRDFTRKN